ncbi:tRNA uracil 4-sulfurtransferase ThiI [Mahella australiensis]|uniref:Probable tRNA sulfurtransferase n=1 Tax=Mahella australiensis (strain DSM 15567 / CIP 107919 / 50-1 BON) TaxID=697281 RepID=F4A041_MAHA5|nr:tRNA uracil 4-sulfurtransferase ThiI [Mahella australiensis]AEE96875.1 thiamine biosynthesis/tRNA modification protein ThiI [Mahella australiensis 50-1 BON]
MNNTVILIRYGEIHLKGLNRPFFENTLVRNIRHALAGFDNAEVLKGEGRFYVRGIEPQRIDEAITRIRKVFGIVSISVAAEVDKDMDVIKAVSVEQMKRAYKTGSTTFKVESRRSDKTFPYKSPDISREVGGYILESIDGLKVDVHMPDVVLNIEIRENAYIYYNRIDGPGGMPVGTAGKAMLLISGGIDSPVAGYMIAKRGVELSAVHYYSFPYTSQRARDKVEDICRILSAYTGPIKIHMVPFTDIQQAIYERCPDNQLTILTRRFMMRIAQKLARQNGCKAIVTGESIGQVASQTIDSLAVTEAAVDMLVLRPLIAFDKVEIMDAAKKIGTYETSILPYEDCCTVFLPRHPVTKPKLEAIENSEELLDIEYLEQCAIENMEIVPIKA